ncbi:hypothetical protein PTSG_07256 [Salpingoeca rosetta]|uniref:Large ribosomal subunit protein mL40 n=1 Tax=Salpingoeca rosetta (strain ATCC 50818 / BSB-021) TaxID=946362 RepID=F2UEI1_SALR5|nr:uncharacterized protein PTSG_07256 [Salpingoeca rosetta]EGD75031.1 hypothetical protein PTSG_07256 [Salpingoeca rosetta]|eukprot:XP_004992675.1 hypothetical protein PTSG_07256 [Salpingoeca rosetta]
MRRALTLMKKAAENEGGVLDMLKIIARPPVARKRPELTREELDRRAKLVKEWSKHCQRHENRVMKRMSQAVKARDRALFALADIDEELLYKACMPDSSRWPLKASKPLATPPIPGYNPQASAKQE